MKKRSKSLKVLAGLSVPALMLMVWAGCSKTEQPKPTTPPDVTEALGQAKLQSDPFIRIIGGPNVSFHICSPYQQIVCNQPGPAIPYVCSNCSPAQIGIKIGVAPDVFCFEPGVTYSIKADTGPLNRQTIKFKFPVGYDECALTPATRFDYNSATGQWALGSVPNGVMYAFGITTCP